ncbi:MAG: hypothetical protein JNM66_05480 [Bryobacterales bacterium]|nr:hypothetical protein [Bryobacterales bacterium]
MIRATVLALACLLPLAAQFSEDVAFLKRHTEVVVLTSKDGRSQVAVVPAWQGRVMTSTGSGPAGRGYGWINKDLIASRKLVPHMNPFGGEDRFWLGPEGGQFSIFFSKGAKFDLASWQTPPPIDTDAYPIASRQPGQVTFQKRIQLTNYSGTAFQIALHRQVRVLEPAEIWSNLGVAAPAGTTIVGFESNNRITNAGPSAWTEKSGLPSVWILGMFNASPATTVVIPIRPGAGPGVTDDYFGKVPAARLVSAGNTVFFRGDGRYRSKIGIGPARAKSLLGSYDAQSGVLTIVQFTLPAGASKYVNSQWKMQDNPFSGDVINSYSDDGKMGAFYEMETSSPAAALAPGQSLEHLHRTIHIGGAQDALDAVAKAVLGVGLHQIRSALP